MIYPVVCKKCGERDEIEKPMAADMPPCVRCGGELRRVWIAPPSVRYDAPGFYETDHARFERQVGKERAAKFAAARDDAERRAKRGTLTGYEKALENI